MSTQEIPRYAPASLACAAALKNTLVGTSVAAGWTSCVLDHIEGNHVAAAHETHATPDLTVVVATRGEHDIDVLSAGRWRSATYQTGAVGLTRGGDTTRLRWRNRRPHFPFRTAHLYVPQAFMAEAAELVRRPGQRLSADLSSLLVVNDQVTASVVSSLLAAMHRQEADTFAETALRWLAMHLVSRFGGADGGRRAVQGDVLPDARLARAVEFMTSELARPISVADIAREAGISPFHFARLFSRRMGVSPHAYLTRCRLEKASTLR